MNLRQETVKAGHFEIADTGPTYEANAEFRRCRKEIGPADPAADFFRTF
jgi:hypothetical protein